MDDKDNDVIEILDENLKEENDDDDDNDTVQTEIIDEKNNFLDDEDFEDFDEIEDLDIDQNNEIIVKKNEKKTFNFLTKYEKNYIMGYRINQIINGSPLFINIDTNKKFDIFKIVEQELIQKKLPFKIKRKLPNGNIEIWDLDDLIIF